jgi:hypothetical protein
MRCVAAAAVLLLVAAGCGSSGSHGGSALPRPASDYSARVDNKWFPLPIGATWVYRGAKDGKRARDVVTVASEVQKIDGVPAAVVHDRLYLDGRLGERTTDWYTQDSDGNVWYFGEDTKELENGKVTSTEGSWQAGQDGALPGIIMPAKPEPDGPYRQEYLAGEAEDMAKVIKLDGTVSNSYGDFTDVLVTEEWSDLEPGVLERKYYVSGIGMVSSEIIKGGDEHFDLTTFEQGSATPEATPGS